MVAAAMPDFASGVDLGGSPATGPVGAEVQVLATGTASSGSSFGYGAYSARWPPPIPPTPAAAAASDFDSLELDWASSDGFPLELEFIIYNIQIGGGEIGN